MLKPKYKIFQKVYTDKQNIVFCLGTIQAVTIQSDGVLYDVKGKDSIIQYNERDLTNNSQKALKTVLKRLKDNYEKLVEQARSDYVKDFTKTDITA